MVFGRVIVLVLVEQLRRPSYEREHGGWSEIEQRRPIFCLRVQEVGRHPILSSPGSTLQCAGHGDWRWRGFWSRSQYQDSTLASRMASPNVPVSLCCSDAASARAASVRARRPAEVVKRCCVRHPQWVLCRLPAARSQSHLRGPASVVASVLLPAPANKEECGVSQRQGSSDRQPSQGQRCGSSAGSSVGSVFVRYRLVCTCVYACARVRLFPMCVGRSCAEGRCRCLCVRARV